MDTCDETTEATSCWLTRSAIWHLFQITNSMKVTKVATSVCVNAKTATLVSRNLFISNIIAGKVAFKLPLDFTPVAVIPLLCVH